jgi:transcriptional regulator with XRE-family HTH domain
MEKRQIRHIFGSNLRKFRDRREWSQMELAEKANISMNFLSEIERGNKWPSAETIQNLAYSLDIEVYELFLLQDKPAVDFNKYIDRFVKDVTIAVQQSTERSILNVQNQYRKK